MTKQLSYLNRLEVIKLGRTFRFRNEKTNPYEPEIFYPENESHIEWLLTNLQRIHIVSLFYLHKVEIYSIMIEYSTYLQGDEIGEIIEEFGYNLDDLQVRKDNHLWVNAYIRDENDGSNEDATYTREWKDRGILENKQDFRDAWFNLIEDQETEQFWH